MTLFSFYLISKIVQVFKITHPQYCYSFWSFFFLQLYSEVIYIFSIIQTFNRIYENSTWLVYCGIHVKQQKILIDKTQCHDQISPPLLVSKCTRIKFPGCSSTLPVPLRTVSVLINSFWLNPSGPFVHVAKQAASSHRICMTCTWCCMYSLRLLMVEGEAVRNL